MPRLQLFSLVKTSVIEGYLTHHLPKWWLRHIEIIEVGTQMSIEQLSAGNLRPSCMLLWIMLMDSRQYYWGRFLCSRKTTATMTASASFKTRLASFDATCDASLLIRSSMVSIVVQSCPTCVSTTGRSGKEVALRTVGRMKSTTYMGRERLTVEQTFPKRS